MRHHRIYSDESGESHIEENEAQTSLTNFAPPSPPIYVSAPESAVNYRFLTLPAGWEGDWHTSPQRQMITILVGEFEIETSDNKNMRFGPGSTILHEGTSGKGHRSRTTSGASAIAIRLSS